MVPKIRLAETSAYQPTILITLTADVGVRRPNVSIGCCYASCVEEHGYMHALVANAGIQRPDVTCGCERWLLDVPIQCGSLTFTLTLCFEAYTTSTRGFMYNELDVAWRVVRLNVDVKSEHVHNSLPIQVDRPVKTTAAAKCLGRFINFNLAAM